MLCEGEEKGGGNSLSITFVCPRFLLNDSLNVEDHYCKLKGFLFCVQELLRRSLISAVCASEY